MRTIGIEYPAKLKIALCDLGEPPEPGPHEVLLETIFSGITNGTERHALVHDHGFGSYPGRHGYQHVARVAAAGDRVTALAVGEVVYYGDYVGHRGWHLIDPAQQRLWIKLPATVEQRHCALFGVAGVALRAVRRTRVSVGDRVWVVGQGLIGAFAAQCARAAGADVTVSDVNPDRLARATACGIRHVVNSGAEGHVAALQARAPYTHILDCSGWPELLPFIAEHRLHGLGTAIGLIALRGEVKFGWGMLHGTQASLEVSCHFGPAELPTLVQLLEEEKLRVAPLVTTELPIGQAVSVYERLRDAPGELLGVIFDWR